MPEKSSVTFAHHLDAEPSGKRTESHLEKSPRKEEQIPVQPIQNKKRPTTTKRKRELQIYCRKKKMLEKPSGAAGNVGAKWQTWGLKKQ